jgi:hypothetical protein
MQNPTLLEQIATVKGYIKSLEKLVAEAPGPCVAQTDLAVFKAILESLRTLHSSTGSDLFPRETHNPPK